MILKFQRMLYPSLWSWRISNYTLFIEVYEGEFIFATTLATTFYTTSPFLTLYSVSSYGM